MARSNQPDAKSSQRERFEAAAKAVGADEDEGAFRANLAAVARHKPGDGTANNTGKAAELAQAEAELAHLRHVASAEDNVSPARDREINRLSRRVAALKAGQQP